MDQPFPARGPSGGRGHGRRHGGCQRDAETLAEPVGLASGHSGRGLYRQAMMEATVLSCLLEGQLHGYDLVEKIEQMIGSYVCIDPGSTYRLLRELENGGHLVSTWQPAESGPARRIYSVTASGRELLAEWATFLERRVDAMKALASRARGQLGAEVQRLAENPSKNEP